MYAAEMHDHDHIDMKIHDDMCSNERWQVRGYNSCNKFAKYDWRKMKNMLGLSWSKLKLSFYQVQV